MTRYVLVNFATKAVEPESFASDKDAWRYIVHKCKGTDQSPYDWDIAAVEIEIS